MVTGLPSTADRRIAQLPFLVDQGSGKASTKRVALAGYYQDGLLGPISPVVNPLKGLFKGL